MPELSEAEQSPPQSAKEQSTDHPAKELLAQVELPQQSSSTAVAVAH